MFYNLIKYDVLFKNIFGASTFSQLGILPIWHFVNPKAGGVGGG
jgi:hypothetical protein